MSNIVIIGAGQTGRGYLNRFFQKESVTFLDKDRTLVKSLQAAPSYQISFGPDGRKPVIVNNYRAYPINSKEGLQCLSEADLVMISVGQQNLKDTIDMLGTALASRTKEDLDILTAENGVNVKKELLPLCRDRRVHLAEAIVFCTTLQQENSLDILSEDLDYLPYDAVSLGHTLPYENMEAEDHLDILMQRKIYTYNCISAAVAYLGYCKGYSIYSEAANDVWISQCVRNILEPLNQCICLEYHISSDEQQRFSDMAVKKFQNRAIVDTIERNARDVDRKLGPSERILAPLSLLRKYNKNCPELLLVAACAIYYGQETGTLKEAIPSYFQTLPTDWTSQIIKGLSTLSSTKFH